MSTEATPKPAKEEFTEFQRKDGTKARIKKKPKAPPTAETPTAETPTAETPALKAKGSAVPLVLALVAGAVVLGGGAVLVLRRPARGPVVPPGW